MEEIMTYALFGYICGSILFARVAAALFHQDREYEKRGSRERSSFRVFLRTIQSMSL